MIKINCAMDENNIYFRGSDLSEVKAIAAPAEPRHLQTRLPNIIEAPNIFCILNPDVVHTYDAYMIPVSSDICNAHLHRMSLSCQDPLHGVFRC